jgi:hypothetical protein
MRAMMAMLVVCAAARAARAEPPSEATAIAAATRFETGPRLCKAMARATRERRDCAHEPVPPRLRWQTAIRGDHRVAQATIGDESFWIITLTVDASGRVIAEQSAFSYGGP